MATVAVLNVQNSGEVDAVVVTGVVGVLRTADQGDVLAGVPLPQ